MADLISNYPYQDAASFGQGLGANFVRMARGIPAMRAQQAALMQRQALLPYQVEDIEQQQKLRAAQTDEAKAHQGLFESQQKGVDSENMAKTAFAAAVKSGDFRNAAVSLSQWGTHNPDEAVRGVVRMLEFAGVQSQAPQQFNLGPGQARFQTVPNPQGFSPGFGNPPQAYMIAQNTKPEAQFTLTPGSERFDSEGNVIADNPRADTTGSSFMAREAAQASAKIVDALDKGLIDPADAIKAAAALKTNNIGPAFQLLGGVGGGASPTNAPPQVAPPAQRKVGDTVTTAKGTFKWDYDGATGTVGWVSLKQ